MVWLFRFSFVPSTYGRFSSLLHSSKLLKCEIKSTLVKITVNIHFY